MPYMLRYILCIKLVRNSVKGTCWLKEVGLGIPSTNQISLSYTKLIIVIVKYFDSFQISAHDLRGVSIFLHFYQILIKISFNFF